MSAIPLSRSRFLRGSLALGSLAAMPLALRLVIGQQATEEATATALATVAAPPEADRAAILAMAGGYRVNFTFEETLAFRDGYQPTQEYRVGAFEWVEVVVDEPGCIELQHILVIDSHDEESEPGFEHIPVIKHWSQEWVWEDPIEFAFVDHQRWEKREISEAERRGTWTQRVLQVDDSPRYEARGHWRHEHGLSTWESLPTWRPLPRRDYSKRDDYHALGCVNRHVVGSLGWVHEQDNTKLIVEGDTITPLVRETGVNTYRAMDEPERFAPARDYWADHGQRWLAVKEGWNRVYTGRDSVAFAFTDHGRALQLDLAALAEEPEVALEDVATRTVEIVESHLV